MKITQTADIFALLSTSNTKDPPSQTRPDLPRTGKTPPCRRSPRPTPRLPSRREGTKAVASGSGRPGPSTPLLRWKFDERDRGGASSSATRGKLEEAEKEEVGARKATGAGVSARKLGAALWRFQSPDFGRGGFCGGGDRRDSARDEDRLGFKVGVGQGGDRSSGHHKSSRRCGSEAKDPLRSPCSVNGPTNGYLHEFSNYPMEGATKWDPVGAKVWNGKSKSSELHFADYRRSRTSVVSSLQAELEKARGRIQELETERKSSKKKMEHFLRKLSEERAAWRSREHEKVRAFIDDMRADLNRERKSHQRLELVNSKLVNDLAEAKLSAKRCMQEYEKERKARELVEEVCDELAKEIGEDKAEADALKRECMNIREEVEEERKMLQMAEVWREERVQMKLVDAKVTLHEKYSQMNELILELENFLMRKRSCLSLDSEDMKEVEMLCEAAASVKVEQGMKEFTYKPPNPNPDHDIFSAFEEIMALGEQNEQEITSPTPASKMHTVSPEVHDNPCNDNHHHRPFISFSSHNGDDLEDDRSGWETVSQVEDRGSSFSPEGSNSIPSLQRTRRDSNVSGSCTDWEINPCDAADAIATPVTEISEVCSMGEKEKQQVKKVSSISRLWRSSNCPKNGEVYKTVSMEGIMGRLSNGRISNCGGIVSPDHDNGYHDGEFSPSDVVVVGDQWSSPDSKRSPQVVGRGKKGCIEWPLGGMQKTSLKQKLFEARVDDQKIQLRQVLKQKI
ncbi:hypothetical protein Dimus_012502 [Dionaea muscipula]